MAAPRPQLQPLPHGTSRLPRIEGLGWMMLYVAGALVFLRAFLGQQLHLPGTLLTLAIAIATALVVAMVRAPWTLRRIDASWHTGGPLHALEDASVGACLRAPRGIGPFSLEAWDPTTRRFHQVLRLRGLSGEEIRPTWNVRFPRRGLIRLPPLVARCDQPFGLISAGREICPPAEVLVLPAIGSTKKGLHTRLQSYLETFASTTSELGDDELAQLRDYRPGDAPHSIHWRASARARTLLVAERQALGGRQLALVVDCTAEGESPRFERLLSGAATLVAELSQERWRLSLHGAFAPTGVRGRPERLLEALALAGSDPRPVSDFIPPGMPALVLSLKPLALSSGEPRPLVLTLAEVEELVHIPSRVR
jgi:uncharacterized protein (DUF58 family)